ncbi:MAG: ATP-binding protein [SAR202 cluster bacterium]|nr:ATP-binding protein [SAR202 cluster bacterium]
MNVLDALKNKQKGGELADRLVAVRKVASNQLEHTHDLFPQYTDHTIRHSDGVLSILDWLLPDEIKELLNEWELYFLIAATYLHDIGMVEGCPGTPDGPIWESFKEEFFLRESSKKLKDSSEILVRAKRDFVRAHHHERSETYIAKNWMNLELRASDTAAEGEIIARIALGHRKVNLADKTLYGEVAFGNNELIRRNLLAAYLRLADELDTTALRTPWSEFEILDINDETSALEWGKHLSISGVSSNEGVLLLSGSCHDHSVYLKVEEVQKEIKAKLDEMKRMLGRPYASGDGFMVVDPIPYHDVDLRLEHRGYLPINLKFELQHEQIVNLIMGERLYGDWRACIRELLQNAVDTCREAQEIRPPKWKPAIEIEVEEDGKVLSFIDNGTGMDESIIRNYFSKIGISYYRSDDFKGSFRPISEFGIGILSAFMIADEIEVDSLREGSDPIQISINSITKSFVPKLGTRATPGTTVRLFLKSNIQMTNESIAQLVRHYCRHIDFPIAIVRRGEQISTIVNKSSLPLDTDLRTLRYYSEARPEYMPVQLANPNREQASFKEDGLEVSVILSDSFLPDSGSHKTVGGLISQNGFYVNAINEEVAKFASQAWVDINLTNESTMDLTADRGRFAQSSQPFWAKMIEVYSLCVEAIYGLSVSNGEPVDWWVFHQKYYSRDLPSFPSALRESAQNSATICTWTNQGFLLRSVDEVLGWPGRFFAIPVRFHSELERYQDMIPDDVIGITVPGQTSGGYSMSNDGIKFTEHLSRWARSILGSLRIGGFQALIDAVGIAILPMEIAERIVWFVDAGSFRGRWRMGVDLTNYAARDRSIAYDLHHPFSQLLVNWCNKPLPRSSSLLIGDLLKAFPEWNQSDGSPETEAMNWDSRFTEVVEALKNDDVIPRDFVLDRVSDWSVGEHPCICSVNGPERTTTT